MEERWLVSIAPKKSDSGIYLSKIELFILRLPYGQTKMRHLYFRPLHKLGQRPPIAQMKALSLDL